MSTAPGAPHDRADLYLAPVAMSVDSWLETHSTLPQEKLKFQITLNFDREPQSRVERESAVIEAILADVDTHGWNLALDERGVRLSHSGRGLVLGMPANLRAYLMD